MYSKPLNAVNEKLINNIMLLYPHVSREVAEKSVAWLIEHPKEMISFNKMVDCGNSDDEETMYCIIRLDCDGDVNE